MSPIETIRRRVAARTCSRREWMLLDRYERRRLLLMRLRAQQAMAPMSMMTATLNATLLAAFGQAARAVLRRRP